LGLAASLALGCSDDGGSAANTGGSGSGGATSTGGSKSGTGGTVINQCGAAAPLPAETGQCKATSTTLITNFDDYTGTTPDSYTFYVNGAPPAADSVLGGVLHVGDGSDAEGSVIATEMVPGEGGTGYALQISDSNASHWGGLLMLYLPYDDSRRLRPEPRGRPVPPALPISRRGSDCRQRRRLQQDPLAPRAFDPGPVTV
jgi:hypothetical protein